MSVKFNRKYLMTIGDYKIEGVRVRFNCEYQIGGFIPIFEIELYNLNRKTVNTLLLRDTPFSFSAGYEENMPVIFQGEIRNVFTVRDDVDLVTQILAGGSDGSLRESKISITIDNPNSVSEIVNIFLFEADINLGEFLIVEKPVVGSISKSGSFKTIMNQLSNEYNFNWFIYNNLFYAYDKDKFPNRDIYKISASTGLLESPILTDRGVDVRTLMEPSIRPQDRYQVESDGLALSQNATAFTAARTNVLGTQAAYQVRHTGDTHGDEWYTELRGISDGNR